MAFKVRFEETHFFALMLYFQFDVKKKTFIMKSVYMFCEIWVTNVFLLPFSLITKSNPA